MPINTRAADVSDVAVAAKLFRGLADPTRPEILLALQSGEQRVVDLIARLGTSQANVSGHLACLKDCGLVADRAQGRANYYRLAQVGHQVDLCANYQPPSPRRRARTRPA